LDGALEHFQSAYSEGTPLLLLSPFHQRVDEFNARQIQRLTERVPVRVFKSFHDMEAMARESMERVESFRMPGVPDHELPIFIGEKVMLMRNLFPSRRLSNGSILQVTGISANTITCLSPLNEHVEIPRIRFKFKIGTIEVVRRQFPLTPAYAGTINKAQGETLPKVIIDLSKPVFMHGQLYVALSRVRRCEDVVIISESREVASVVYHRLLELAGLKKKEG
jgi:ATP-dependent exoDNAse (exonuclease V) alpha subunit